MTTGATAIERVLAAHYYDKGDAGGYAGVDGLWRAAHKDVPSLTRPQVARWLREQLTYQLHKQPRHNFRRNPIVVDRIDELWEADLVDLCNLARYNDGYKYLLVVIDVFSKQLHVRPLKAKSAAVVADAFAQIFETSQPQTLRSDLGSEFRNATLRKLLRERHVQQIFARNPRTKAPVVEVVNRTLKSLMFKLITRTGSPRYIEATQRITDGYNARRHRSIKMAPRDVTPAVSRQVFRNLYGYDTKRDYQRAAAKLKHRNLLSVGDAVRLKYDLSMMDKRYLPSWSDAVYRVVHVTRGALPVPMYKIARGSQIEPRRFYSQELQRIRDPALERVVVKRRDTARGRVLVSWPNQVSRRSQWISEAELQNV